MNSNFYERTFVVFVDSEMLRNDAKEVVLASASELFCVSAKFDDDTDDGGNVKWISVKSKNSENNDAAKAYIIACFNPQSKCPQKISAECCDLLQDAYGLWWRSLEHEFKIRMSIVPLEDAEYNEKTSKQFEDGAEFAMLNIQGDQEAVAFASSYISELDEMLTSPPEDSEIDKASVRREFTNELMNFNELKWAKYSSYNAYVLRTLLKWIYFVKGVTPPNEDYVLSMPPPVNDSLIVLLSDEEEIENNETKNKLNKNSETATKTGEDAIDLEPIASSSLIDVKDGKRKMDQTVVAVNSSSNDSSLEILEATSSTAAVDGRGGFGGVPVQVTNKKSTSSKRFALSTSPLGKSPQATVDDKVDKQQYVEKITGTFDSLQEAIKMASLTNNAGSSRTSLFADNSPSVSTTSAAGISSSNRTNSEFSLTQNDNGTINGIINKSSSTSYISTSGYGQQDFFNDFQQQQYEEPVPDPIPEIVLPPDMYKNVEFSKLRPVIIDGSNVAMQYVPHNATAQLCVSHVVNFLEIMLNVIHILRLKAKNTAFNGEFRSGMNKRFACRAILLAAKHFIERGHAVLAFVPQFRHDQNPNNPNRPIDDQHLLSWMEMKRLVVFTPSRQVILQNGDKRRYACYDDNMIVQYAHLCGGVILSKDNYRDVAQSHPAWQSTIEKRLIMFTWIGDELMVPEDPHGKRGPSLDQVLRFSPNEKIEKPMKSMDEQTCRDMLKQIHVALNSPPPPPRLPHPVSVPRWNQSNVGYRFKPYQDWRDMETVNVPRPLMSYPVSQPYGFQQPQMPPTSQQRSRWRSKSPPQTTTTAAAAAAAARRDSSLSRGRARERENAIEILSEIFPRDCVERVMNENRDVIDVAELSNLITDAM